MADGLVTIAISEARKLALVAQGFGQPRPTDRAVNLSDIQRVFDRVKLVQIDSVNALIRTQYIPFFSRLGSYPIELLNEYAYGQRKTFEYWIHEACMAPVDQYQTFRHRTVEWAAERRWSNFLADHPNFEADIIAEVKQRGPLSVSEIDMRGPKMGYWATSPAKLALYHLHRSGRLMISDRYRAAPKYDLVERVTPEGYLNEPEMSPQEALRHMALMATDAMGIATLADIADYYRVLRRDLTPIIRDLLAAGQLEVINVEGIKAPMYAQPGWESNLVDISASALLSPFDSLVWCRQRIEALFMFHYRIEIYVPASKRKFGYYVLPFLQDESLVARVDLKCDRKARVLRVPGAFIEPDAIADSVSHGLAIELHLMAEWLGMERVGIGRRGNLVTPLRHAVKEVARKR